MSISDVPGHLGSASILFACVAFALGYASIVTHFALTAVRKHKKTTKNFSDMPSGSPKVQFETLDSKM